MAKKDVIRYYLEQQNIYFESLANVKDFDEALKGGFITEEQFKGAQEELKVIKDNYERLSYIMFLLNKPNRDKNKYKEEKLNKEWYDVLKGSSREALLDESKDALSDFKKRIKEIKKETKDE